MIERLYTFDGRIVTIEPKVDFYPLLAVAAADAGIHVRDRIDTLQPHFSNDSPVLVIVPPAYYQRRAQVKPVCDVPLSGSNGKASKRKAKPQANQKRKARRVTRKRGTRANTGRK